MEKNIKKLYEPIAIILLIIILIFSIKNYKNGSTENFRRGSRKNPRHYNYIRKGKGEGLRGTIDGRKRI